MVPFDALCPGLVEDARRHYLLAIECDENFADPWSNLGNLLKDQGQSQLAIQHYQRAIQLNPRHADAYSNMASTYKDANCIEEAILFYQSAIHCRPCFPDALSDLVHCLTLVCCWKVWAASCALGAVVCAN